MNKPSASTSKDWLTVIHERLRARNDKESRPFVSIYTSNKHLWDKSNYLDAVRVSAKHNLALLEHETSDNIAKGDYEQAVRHCTKRITAIHSELRPFNGRGKEKNEQNLSKTILDQRKLISNQEEEMKVAKLHLAESFDTIAKYEEGRAHLTKTVADLEEELRFLRSTLVDKESMVATLKADNADLTLRIITEKNKSAKEMDEMNKLLSRTNRN